MGSTCVGGGWGGQFGQNSQKLCENYKNDIFGGKQCRGSWEGGQTNFLSIGESPPQSLPTRGNPVISLLVSNIISIIISY